MGNPGKRETMRGFACRTPAELDTVHAFLWAKRDARNLLVCDQKALAIEIEMPQVRFHRNVQDLLDAGRLKIVAKGMRGLKTFLIFEP